MIPPSFGAMSLAYRSLFRNEVDFSNDYQVREALKTAMLDAADIFGRIPTQFLNGLFRTPAPYENCYHLLLRDIFGTKIIDTKNWMMREAEMLLKTAEFSSAKDLATALTNTLYREIWSGHCQMSPLTEDDIEVIEAQLLTLSPREQSILRRTYGINEEKLAGEALTAHFRISRERIRQLQAKAIRKLRHTSRSQHLKELVTLFDRWDKLTSQVQGLKARLNRQGEEMVQVQQRLQETEDALKHTPAFLDLQAQIPTPIPVIPKPHAVLDQHIDELELSVRAYNCLKYHTDIRTVRDLAQRTERAMRATKNFGRKSLNELKDVLQSMGLDFGTKFDDQGNPLPKEDTLEDS